MPRVHRAQVEAHLEAFLECTARWQLGPEAGRNAGGLACPVARMPMQWTEFFTLPIAVRALESGDATGDAAALVTGLVDYLARVQRESGAFDAGFCGDLAQPCNAGFALRPLATALRGWLPGFDGARRERLADVLRRAAGACVEGGMNTANHRWVAAAGLAHASRALDDAALADAAQDWTAAGVDIDADGAYSEGSPKYALVSNDCFLDLEALLGRRDLGDLARRSVGYLRAVGMPDGGFATVASVRYDTEGSSDEYARAARVFEVLGERELADRSLARLWCARALPGLMAANAIPPLGAVPKAKLYPSVVSAISAESLLRWLEVAPDGAAGPGAAPEVEHAALPASGLLRYQVGDFVALAARGPSWLELHHGASVIEGARLLGHASGWNALWTTGQTIEDGAMRLELSTAPGSPMIRLPQFHRDDPGERRPGLPVPAIAGHLELRFGPGRRIALEIELDGLPGASALLELAARPDQAIFDADGVPAPRVDGAPVHAAPPSGRCAIAGPGPERIVVEHAGGSGHALQVAPYGYGSGDDLWSPSFRPGVVRIGLELPARLRLRIHGE